jgi:NAD(P)-dependent dehydrogenase (short-subunit alcohol dehydrogenase family)
MLEGKTSLVTGSTSGIGARIAWKLMISGERYCTKYAEA